MSEALAFLETIYRYKPEEAYVLVWALEGERSFWFRELGEASRLVASLPRSNLFFQVALSPRDYGTKQRCKAEDTLGIPGLWADLDFGSEGHKKKNLPPTVDDVLSLLDEVGIAPTLMVHSGHGIQAYWLFKEPWIFDTPEEREKARQLVRGWEATIRMRARGHGWDVDATHDLARVLRVPGSVNLKGEPVPVREFRNGGARVNPSDFEEFILPVPPAAAVGELPQVCLRADAEPPWPKLRVLEQANEKFRLSLARKRKDLQDASPSAYDSSIASHAMWDGWTDQQIADTIIWSRGENGEDVQKALRADYIPRLLSKYRTQIQHEEAVSELEQLYADETAEEPDKEKLIELLRPALLIDLTEIIRFLGEEPQYVLHTDEGSVKLGDIDGLIKQPQLRKSIAKAFRKYIPDFKPARWRVIAQALLDFADDEDPGPETTDAGLLAYWLDCYLIDNEPAPLKPEILKEGMPFTKGGFKWISAGGFLDYLTRRHSCHLSLRELCQMLKRFGAVRGSEDLRHGKIHTSRSVWRVAGVTVEGENEA